MNFSTIFQFAAVLSKETKYPVQINAYHATKFSLKAFYHGYYGNAIDWANYANLKLDKERDYSISKELVHYMREFMGKSVSGLYFQAFTLAEESICIICT